MRLGKAIWLGRLGLLSFGLMSWVSFGGGLAHVDSPCTAGDGVLEDALGGGDLDDALGGGDLNDARVVGS